VELVTCALMVTVYQAVGVVAAAQTRRFAITLNAPPHVPSLPHPATLLLSV
jgi:hypothetical protein